MFEISQFFTDRQDVSSRVSTSGFACHALIDRRENLILHLAPAIVEGFSNEVVRRTVRGSLETCRTFSLTSADGDHGDAA